MRRVKEFLEIKDHASLDDLIGQLTEVRAGLPADSDAEMRLRGDDVFGRKLCISYFRDQTAEEAEFEARYTAAQKESQQRDLARLQEELGVVCYTNNGRRKLRIVA